LRAPGLWPKKCRAPRQKNWGSRALWLYFRGLFSQNHHFAQAPHRKCFRLWAPQENFWAFKDPPPEILFNNGVAKREVLLHYKIQHLLKDNTTRPLYYGHLA